MIKVIIVSIKHRTKNLLSKISSNLRGFDDYFNFPFSVDQPMGPNAAHDFYTAVKYLEHNEIPYWVADGTLLGIYRDERLIPHDTDIDFYLTEGVDVESLIEGMTRAGFVLGRKMSRSGLHYQIIFYCSTQTIIDFCIWHNRQDGFLYWEGPEIKSARRQPEYFFLTCTRIEWNGFGFNTFRDTEDWLVFTYGEDWIVPENTKSDWRVSVKDIVNTEIE
jgi:hypothetical protein